MQLRDLVGTSTDIEQGRAGKVLLHSDVRPFVRRKELPQGKLCRFDLGAQIALLPLEDLPLLPLGVALSDRALQAAVASLPPVGFSGETLPQIQDQACGGLALRVVRRPQASVLMLRGKSLAAGLTEVEIGSLTMRMNFASFEDYWDPLVGGQGPVGVFVVGLSAAQRERLRTAVRAAYLSGRPDGHRSLTATAWAIRVSSLECGSSPPTGHAVPVGRDHVVSGLRHEAAEQEH